MGLAVSAAVAGVMVYGWKADKEATTAAAKEGTESILTTTQLRNLPPLKETNEIKPTGETKSFTLEIKPGKWELVKGTSIDAITVNGSIPGPEIRVKEGDTVRVTVKNNLQQETAIHWHGLHVPNNMDGVPPLTQNGIKPGESFTYEFPANHAGTFMYHSHLNSVEQIDKGLYGPFIIDPQKPEDQPKYDKDITWMLSGWIVNETNGMAHGGGGMNYNYWTINGKAFPDTKPLTVKKGEKVRMRLINISNLAHPMHLHGHDFRVIAEDGHPVAQPQVMNTIDVAPGKIYDIEFIADNPGTWVFHCHELHHTMNGEVEPGGLIGVIQYEGQPAPSATEQKGQSPNMNMSDQNMPGMKH
ncbi:hypothetical protein EFBL_3321 [Effusibacillus lacus]|uniref:Copper-containing nitrite reductase n=2 Tax=Effusibacillus lacus TaxID=1348429 RepID=A0A292YRT9_9BACL|nr:hypothetical protein EFBL_3321 [Effusibacillus lacus]